jgi:hypothetical protein
MTNEELLTVADDVLRRAIEDAEFSCIAKDLAYVKLVMQKCENLRAKIGARRPVRIARVFLDERRRVQAEIAWTHGNSLDASQ